MSPRIDPLDDELLAQMCVPVVLDLVVGPSWNPARYQRPPATTVSENPNFERTLELGWI